MCDCVARDALRRATTAFSHSKQLTRSSHSHAHTLKRRFWDFSATPYIYIFIGKYVSTCVPSKNLNKNCHENITGTNTMTFPFDNFLFSGPNRRMHWFFFCFMSVPENPVLKGVVRSSVQSYHLFPITNRIWSAFYTGHFSIFSKNHRKLRSRQKSIFYVVVIELTLLKKLAI